MKRTPAALLALILLTAPACGFVQDVVRDPVGTGLEALPFPDDVYAYIIDGALNVVVLSLVILDVDGLEEHPGWICYATCRPNEENVDSRIGHLSCANCETEDGVYIASDDVALVVTEGDWRIAEFADNDSNAVATSFEASGDTSWTWTHGDQEIVQPVYVRDAMDIAAFDLAAGAENNDAEIDRVEIAVGESIDLELLPVDAEGHVLAANYLDVSFAHAVAYSERVSFTRIEGWDNAGTIARITGSAAGESSFVVRCAGVERTFEIVVR